VHLGLGHDNSFSPLFLAAPAPGTIRQHRSPGLTPASGPRDVIPLAARPRRAATTARGYPRWPTQPNAQNTNLVNK
jgi:hypothetical protein